MNLGAQLMADNPMDSLHSFDRVSIRAVLVHDGEDPSAALAEAGIFDPVAIPVLMDHEGTSSDGILGDGITPNLTAVLESRHEGSRDSPANRQKPAGRPEVALASQYKSSVRMLPAAFGLRPLAPVGTPGPPPRND
jgi:hypothetical protein